MAYFAITIFYCALFTVGAYMFIKQIRDVELQHLRNKHDQQIEELRRELVNTIGQLDSKQQIINEAQINKLRDKTVKDFRRSSNEQQIENKTPIIKIITVAFSSI